MAQSIADQDDEIRHGRRFRPPPPPVVSAALSGFLIGVVLTLVATGAVSHHTSSSPPPTALPTTPVPDAALQTRITKTVSSILGPMPSNPKRSRLLALDLDAPAPGRVPLNREQKFAAYWSVTVIFRLNNHPLGKAWRLRAARADVFSVMKALYSSQLPIYDVTMQGKYPLKRNGTTKMRSALVVSLAHATADIIPWKKWNRGDEAKLWGMLTYRWINPEFASLP